MAPLTPEERVESIGDELKRAADWKVLIVGGRDSNFSPEIRNDKRLVFWDSTDPETFRRNQIPVRVKVVILTRFITHRIYTNLKENIPLGVHFLDCSKFGTGLIRKAIQSLQRIMDSERRVRAVLEVVPAAIAAAVSFHDTVAVDNPIDIEPPRAAEPAYVPERSEKMAENDEASGSKNESEIKPSIMKRSRGFLRKFVSENANFSVVPVAYEIDRLFNYAASLGMKTTRNSVAQTLRILRKRRLTEQNPESVVPEVKAEPARLPKPPDQTEVEKPVPAKTDADAIHFLRSLKENAEFLELALEEPAKENERLKTEVERLKLFEDKYRRIKAALENGSESV